MKGDRRCVGTRKQTCSKPCLHSHLLTPGRSLRHVDETVSGIVCLTRTHSDGTVHQVAKPRTALITRLSPQEAGGTCSYLNMHHWFSLALSVSVCSAFNPSFSSTPSQMDRHASRVGETELFIYQGEITATASRAHAAVAPPASRVVAAGASNALCLSKRRLPPECSACVFLVRLHKDIRQSGAMNNEQELSDVAS